MYFRTEGVILKRRNFGEADRILSIYTRDFGKVTALAKGVRRPRSRKGGHLELGNWCKIFVARGKNLDLLTEVELKKAFGISDFNTQKANRIYHLLELVDILTPEHQKNLEAYILLVQFLKKCTDGENFNLVSSVFKIKLLTFLGFFSASAFNNPKTRQVFEFLQNEDFEKIKEKINKSQKSLDPQSRVHRGTRTARFSSEARGSYSKKSYAYLKLLSFLDSMIENITQSKLKTSRFL